MSKINIRESLRNMDADSCCKYDLLTMYDACPLTDEDKADIAKLLFDNEDPEVIYQKLCTYFCDDDVSELTGLTDVQNVTPFEAIINNVKMGLDQKYDSVFYNDVAGQFEIMSKDTTYTFGLSPVEYETDGISLYVDYNYDVPINYTSIKEASEDILNKCIEKVSAASQSNGYVDDDTMEYTVYDVVEDEGRLCAKCMNESTNSFEDIKLGKVNSDAVNELLNNILNNPNYKLTNDCRKKIADNSAPWGIVMSPSFDITASNALMSTGDFGGSVSFGESEELTFEKGDRVTDGNRKGTVIDCDSIKVLVDWDYSETDDIEWVMKEDLSFVNSLKESAKEDLRDGNLTEQDLLDAGYKYVASNSPYNLYRKILSGKGDWYAVNYENNTVQHITYAQARGDEPIDDKTGIKRLSKELGKKLLPQNESVDEGDWGYTGTDDLDEESDIVEEDAEGYVNLREAFEDTDELELKQAQQEFSSAATSINSTKLPAIYNMVNFRSGDVVVDFGGGKFDNAVNYLKDKGVTLLVYDPYNRSAEHNKEVLRILKEHGGADAAVNSNVLNVIKEPEAREAVLRNIKKITKSGAPIYITVYEGRGDGAEGPTKSGYQLNRKTSDYMDEIGKVFSNVKRKGKLITAINESTKHIKSSRNETFQNDKRLSSTSTNVPETQMIDDLEYFYEVYPEAMEPILIRNGATPDKDNWLDGCNIPQAYNEAVAYFESKYDNDDEYSELDTGVGSRLGWSNYIRSGIYEELDSDDYVDDRRELASKSTEGYVYTYCDECGKKNRVKVTFNNFNEPFNDTEYKCKYCGANNLLTDPHSYDKNGNLVEASDDGGKVHTKSGYQLNRKTGDYMNESIVTDASNIGQGYAAPIMVSLVTKAKELAKEYKNNKDKDGFERLLPIFEDNILDYKSEIEEKIKDFDKYWEVHKKAMLDNISEAVSILKNIGIPGLDSKLSKLDESYSDDEWVDKMWEAFQDISGIKDISEGKNPNTYIVTFDSEGSATARARILLKALIKADLDIELDSSNGSNVFTFITPTNEWEFIKGKMIKDSDGFLTSYDWYRNTDSGLNIFMFGEDEADPDYADWETESDAEAEDWFNSYKGFEDEEELDESVKSSATAEIISKELKDAAYKLFKTPEWGFETDKEIKDYINPFFDVSEDTKTGGIEIEVRAELDYDNLMELADVLNKVVEKYDNDSYFDAEQPGIISAFIRYE